MQHEDSLGPAEGDIHGNPFCLYRVKLAPTKTTIGQVCSFVKGLQERTVVDVPGFCCLDAPYSSSDWGEKVRY